MATSAVDPSHPPVPPHCFGLGAQSTNYWGDRVVSIPSLIAPADSSISEVAKAQQEPHPP